jgi:methionyl aminopeptidase
VILLKTDNEMKLMREANRIIAVVLTEIRDRIKTGVSTYDLDQWAEKRILDLGAKPGFKGYKGYPATLCTSINQEVVHGVPSKEKILEDGDIISIDVGSIYKGFYGDGAYTYAVGNISDEAKNLLETCEESLYVGIEQSKLGNRINDISIAIDRFVRSRGYEIVRDLTGHGIGRYLHEEPQILNYDNGLKGPKLKTNMTLAIEPMITNGSYEIRTLNDMWTVVTVDGSLSAHFEHTVVVTSNGPEILTRL